MNIIVYKPRWDNNEWTFNFIPYFSMTKKLVIMHLPYISGGCFGEYPYQIWFKL